MTNVAQHRLEALGSNTGTSITFNSQTCTNKPEEVGSEPLGKVNHTVARVLGVKNVLEVLLLTGSVARK